tara:strand:+ start:20 stop:523 length:504 start_codon:yes stop_codon:yes gene_type:complete
MQFNFFKLYLVVALCLLNWSCAIFHPDKVERDDDGYYYRHYSSCGPTALNKAFKELNINLGRNNISRDIQDSGNIFRFLLSLVHYDTVQITFPSEVYQVIEDNGFKVIELKTLEELDSEVDVALVLVASNYLKGQAHWLCFPVDKNIEDFFGKSTRVIKIFLLKKVD